MSGRQREAIQKIGLVDLDRGTVGMPREIADLLMSDLLDDPPSPSGVQEEVTGLIEASQKFGQPTRGTVRARAFSARLSAGLVEIGGDGYFLRTAKFLPSWMTIMKTDC